MEVFVATHAVYTQQTHTCACVHVCVSTLNYNVTSVHVVHCVRCAYMYMHVYSVGSKESSRIVVRIFHYSNYKNKNRDNLEAEQTNSFLLKFDLLLYCWQGTNLRLTQPLHCST